MNAATATLAARPADPGTIDHGHLSAMTLGDPLLEREILQLFDRQAELMLARITASEPACVAGAAHILKGSARGIGAWPAAQAAESLEQAAAGDDAKALRVAVAEMSAAIAQTRAVIAQLLRA